MCEQRIVDDEHGCKKLVYKRPPVTTSYASTESCDLPIFNGGGRGNSDGEEKPTPNPCNYPVVNNDPLCPTSYSHMFGGKPCPAVGLACAYPGAGDGTADPRCFSTAMLWCRPSADAGADAGDGGAGTWVPAQ